MKNTYNLVKKVGFSGEYVDRLSPNDVDMYIMYYKEEEDRKRKEQQKGNAVGGMNVGSSVNTMRKE